MLIFAIETSCDETAASVVKDGDSILSSVISSQIPIHKKYSGVVPELAGRAHIENINSVMGGALKEAGVSLKDFSKKVSAICYTRGPGLAGSLLVGQVAAQTLSLVTGVPAVDVNHIEGHMYACLLEHPGLKLPYLALTVSGGHTELTIIQDFGRYKYLGGTRDDATLAKLSTKSLSFLNSLIPAGRPSTSSRGPEIRKRSILQGLICGEHGTFRSPV